MKLLIIIVMLALGVAGIGVTVAAGDALPGDSLYSLKLGVTEPITGWFPRGDVAAAERFLGQAGRRLDELEELASEGRLETRAAEEGRYRFEEAAFRGLQHIDHLPEFRLSHIVRLFSRGEALFEAHALIIHRIAEDEAIGPLQELVVAVDTVRDTFSAKRSVAEQRLVASGGVGVAPILYDDLLQTLLAQEVFMETSIDTLYPSTVLPEGVRQQLEARLRVAEQSLTQGRLKMKAGVLVGAFASFQRVERAMIETRTVMERARVLKPT